MENLKLNKSANSLEELLNAAKTEGETSIDPATYQYFNCLKNRKIIINDSITSEILERVIIPLQEMDNDGSFEPIEIILDTTGGEIYMGFALVDAIEKLQTKTTVRIMGMAMSMGIYIAMAGFNNPNVEVVCTKYSVGLIHAGIVGYGVMEANAARDLSDFNDKYEKTIIRPFVLSHSKITEELCDKIERKEYYMTAEEMVELGIVDRIQ